MADFLEPLLIVRLAAIRLPLLPDDLRPLLSRPRTRLRA